MVVEVIDASALAALLFGEPEGAAIADRLRGASLVAPALLPFEMANICLKKLRRHPAQRQALLSAFALMVRMDIAAVAVDHAEVLDLAERSGLSAYDASYLWLARKLGVGLVTLDRMLEAADARGRNN